MTPTSPSEADPPEPRAASTRAIVGDEVSLHLHDIAGRIAAADPVLLTCHRGPDGDSLGSMVALASLLRARGKTAVLYHPDSLPRRLRWLPLARSFVRTLARKARFALTVVVDCADARLLGDRFPRSEVTGPILALDHHSASVPFGDLYVCDPGAASVGVLVARLARHLGWPLTAEASLGIYVSLVTDTGSFRYANTTPEALALAAELVAGGVDPWLVSERLFERASLARYRLLGAALSSLAVELGGKVAILTITRDMLEQAGATWEDTLDLVNYARALDGVECGLLMSPVRGGRVRVSMRSKGSRIDAGAICAQLGGGGHRGAAGCVLTGELEAARARVLDALALALGVERPAAPDADASVADALVADASDTDG